MNRTRLLLAFALGAVSLSASAQNVPPVVASQISGFKLLMQQGVEGLLVDHDGAGTNFAEALDHLLDNPELAQRMGVAGRERAVSSFAWEIVVDRLEELYERLLAERGHVRRAAALTA